MQESTVVMVNGIETFLFVEGEGAPVVLIHGMTASAESWLYTFDTLKIDYRVYAPDLPGHGRSARGNYPYCLDFYQVSIIVEYASVNPMVPCCIFGWCYNLVFYFDYRILCAYRFKAVLYDFFIFIRYKWNKAPPYEFALFLSKIAAVCLVDECEHTVRKKTADELGLVLYDTSVPFFALF